MARDTRIFKTLQKHGLKVEYVEGWTERGSAFFAPEGVLSHWTAGPRGAKGRPSLRVCTYGHSTLPGPLCNVYLARDGVAIVVAAGRANHAGYGLWKGLTGNTKLFGIEAEAADGNDWTNAQRESYPKVVAALLELAGTKDASFMAGHSEYALPRGRKIDINGYTTDRLRKQVQAVINGENLEVAPAGEVEDKVEPTKPKRGKKQKNSSPPNGSTKFPTDYQDLDLDGKLGPMTVGAAQILMEAIKIGVRYNQRWDGDFGSRTVKDVQEWLRANGFYKTTTKGVPLLIDGAPGYWFWRELQRFLRSRGHYVRTSKGLPLRVDGSAGYWTICALQSYLNTQNGK
ncbi:peptidoglycan recognition protein family protein [Zhihengliuella halotolerans]|uniref:peptidoglycan recognition protein family protein n=1 Tax=Zhihengliuella halotolerans TaxID=370736 RepID=UPI000C8026EA|nr:N-acetylmuramoyl-L-alanine amidase [Zhihengliuella halotolerans]